MNSKSLSEFILAEMEKRGMSAREFARLMGVSHATINRLLDYEKQDIGYPSVDFMLKLARATDTDMGTLMTLIDLNPSPIDPETLVIAQQLQRLSEAERKTIYAMIRGVLAEHEKS